MWTQTFRCPLSFFLPFLTCHCVNSETSASVSPLIRTLSFKSTQTSCRVSRQSRTLPPSFSISAFCCSRLSLSHKALLCECVCVWIYFRGGMIAGSFEKAIQRYTFSKVWLKPISGTHHIGVCVRLSERCARDDKGFEKVDPNLPSWMCLHGCALRRVCAWRYEGWESIPSPALSVMMFGGKCLAVRLVCCLSPIRHITANVAIKETHTRI